MRRLRLPRFALPRFTAGQVDALVFLAGLVLFGVGLSLWYLPAGLAATGAVLMVNALFGDKPR